MRDWADGFMRKVRRMVDRDGTDSWQRACGVYEGIERKGERRRGKN